MFNSDKQERSRIVQMAYVILEWYLIVSCDQGRIVYFNITYSHEITSASIIQYPAFNRTMRDRSCLSELTIER